MRTLLGGAAAGVASGVGEGVANSCGVAEREGDSSNEGEGVCVGDSCAAAITAIAIHDVAIRNPQSAIRNSNIITPVHVREKIVAPFTVPKKFFIHIVCRKLIVQSVEAGKMIHRAFGCVFARCPSFHEECPVARLREQ